MHAHAAAIFDEEESLKEKKNRWTPFDCKWIWEYFGYIREYDSCPPPTCFVSAFNYSLKTARACLILFFNLSSFSFVPGQFWGEIFAGYQSCPQANFAQFTIVMAFFGSDSIFIPFSSPTHSVHFFTNKQKKIRFQFEMLFLLCSTLAF